MDDLEGLKKPLIGTLVLNAICLFQVVSMTVEGCFRRITAKWFEAISLDSFDYFRFPIHPNKISSFVLLLLPSWYSQKFILSTVTIVCSCIQYYSPINYSIRSFLVHLLTIIFSLVLLPLQGNACSAEWLLNLTINTYKLNDWVFGG